MDSSLEGGDTVIALAADTDRPGDRQAVPCSVAPDRMGENLKRRVRKVAGWDIPVTIASDAVVAGLKAYAIKRRIAIVEPDYPGIEHRLDAVTVVVSSCPMSSMAHPRRFR